MAKNLVILNVTPGDGECNLVDSCALQTQMEAIAEGGKTIHASINFAAGGAIQSSGNQYQWLVEDTNLATADDIIATFIGANVFAETPTYAALALVTPAPASKK